MEAQLTGPGDAGRYPTKVNRGLRGRQLTNPYQPTSQTTSSSATKDRRTITPWILTPFPIALSMIAMTSSLLVGRIGLLHLSLISIVPLGIGVGGGIVLSDRLFSRPALQFATIAVYLVLTVAAMNVCTLWVPIPFP